MKILDLRNVDWGNVKALLSLEITVQTPNNQSVTFTIKDLKLIEGSNGLFVASPSIKYEKDGETKYKNVCDFGPTFQSMVSELVSDAYDPMQPANNIYSEKTEYNKGDGNIPF